MITGLVDNIQLSEELNSTGPSYFVFDVPVSIYRDVFADEARKKPDRALQPVLAVRVKEGEIIVPDESLTWCRNMIDQWVPVAEIRRKLNTVGRLFEYCNTVIGDGIVEPGAIDQAVFQYLIARAENPFDPAMRRFPHWQQIRYERIHIEFRDLLEFARFCANYTGRTSVIGNAFKSQSEIWTSVKRNSPPEDFLMHLEAQRDRWNILQGDDEVLAPPSALKRIAAQSTAGKNGNTTSLSIEEIDALIDLENNFIFKALWILLAYAGPRLSEALNAWICDIINAADGKKLFLTDFVGPVVIFADPKHSRFLGALHPVGSTQTRSEYLDTEYGLKPRPDQAGKSMRAGWKGMTVFNARYLITHGTWTCQKRAMQFAELIDQIRDFHAENGIARMHPYLFVNGKNAEYLGEPLKISNVKKAFDRACLRAGIQPHSPGASLHGFRHYYTWYAKHVLGLDESIIQLMLRQKSPMSQHTYGKRASDIHDAMSQFAEHRRLGA